MSAICARQKYENYEGLFHITVSQKEALEIIDFEVSAEKTKIFYRIPNETPGISVTIVVENFPVSIRQKMKM